MSASTGWTASELRRRMLDLWYAMPAAERIEIAARGVRGVPVFAGDLNVGGDPAEKRATLAPDPRSWTRPSTWRDGGIPEGIQAIDANDDADGGGFAHPV